MRSLSDAQFWQPIIENARDVLKINICVVDANSSPVYISNSENHYGSGISDAHYNVLSKYKNMGNGRWEFVDPYGFFFYALKITNDSGDIIGFIVIGPVILSKRLAVDEYVRLIEDTGENSEDFFERLEEIRGISHINLDSIFNLTEALLTATENKQCRNLYAPYENILNSVFQVSLTIANAKSGSLMIFNEESKKLFICTSKGISDDYQKYHLGLDEGVSGKAFQEQKSYILRGNTDPGMPRQFLNRMEIQESIVMPFAEEHGKIRGVLNLNYLSKSSADLVSVNQRISQFLGDVFSNL